MHLLLRFILVGFLKKSNLGHNGKRAIILIELRGGFQNLTFRKYSKQVSAKRGV